MITLKAFNNMGEGIPVYESAITRQQSGRLPTHQLRSGFTLELPCEASRFLVCVCETAHAPPHPRLEPLKFPPTTTTTPQNAWQMVPRLPVSAPVTWVTARLPPGVAQDVGCTIPVPPSRLPTSSFSLDGSILCLLRGGGVPVGGSHYDTSHVCKLPGGEEGGRGTLGVQTRTVIQ